MIDNGKNKSLRVGVKCFNSFYYFFKTFWPEMSGEKYIDAKHIEFICDQLQFWAMKIIRQEKCMKTICISVPPGSSKSTIVTIALPAWVWLRAPQLSTINISYSATLSEEHAYKARAITDSERWRLLFDDIFIQRHGKSLTIEKQNRQKMENNFKGKRYSTSVGGTLLGMHGDIFCNDDAMSAEQTNSDTERSKGNRWLDETKTSRRKNPHCYLDINISQRLHEEDSIGHILQKNLDILYICLPAEISENTKHVVSPPEALDLYTDGILDINRRPKDVLEVIREEMGAYGYNSQYLQVPFDLESQAITPNMFNYCEDRDDIVWDLWIDGAYTEKTENDPSGLMVAGYKDNQLYVRKVYNVFKTLPQLLAFVKELGNTNVFNRKHGRIFIEPKASGYSLAQYIKEETTYNTVLIGQNTIKGEKNIVSQGKTARHNLIQPKAESGRINLVKGGWNEDYITQICGFPRAAHDEQVDNTGYAINHYFLTASSFIANHAINRLIDNIQGFIMHKLTYSVEKYKVVHEYVEAEDGNVMIYDFPNRYYKHRYISVLSLPNGGIHGGETVIEVYDRHTKATAALFHSDKLSPTQAGEMALALSFMYSNARLVVNIEKETEQAKTEENDIAQIALRTIRSVRYDNIFSRVVRDRIKHTREREYGYIINSSTKRDIFYHLKEKVEKNEVREVPIEVFEEVRTLERKSEDGMIDVPEGMPHQFAVSHAVAVKVDDEMMDDVAYRR